MIIDSHLHINSKVIQDKQQAIKKVNDDTNIESVINVGLDIETSRECVRLSNRENKFYAAVGIHPLYIKEENSDWLIRMCFNNDKVVAIGEIGLDASKKNLYQQKINLIRQIMIANAVKLPVIIHSNLSNREIINTFENYVKPKFGCVFHGFQQDLEDLKYILDNGYYVSFDGRIVYKNNKKILEVLNLTPLDRFLIETNGPFLNKNDIKEFTNIRQIISKVAETKNLSKKEIEYVTNKNVKTLFKRMK